MSSPSSPTLPRRRLSARRGSISAPDPYAKNGQINLNSSRLLTSTLTIVKVVPTSDPNQSGSTISLHDPPLPGQRRSHRRNESNEGGRGRPDAPGGSPRMSFAFSSFGPRTNTKSEQAGGRTPSPSSPSRLRPSSPGGNRSYSSAYTAPKPKLTPEQLYDLAHHATSPQHFPSSYSRASPQYPVGGSPRPSSALSSTGGLSTGTTSATFTPLHPSIYLPFVDRPTEIQALIESTPTRKLFALLKQTFPKNSSVEFRPTAARFVVANPDVPPSPESIRENISPIPSDPTTWSYDHLLSYLTTTSRDDVPDVLWVAKIRKCMLSHSELIWERVKGALGVPPELDVDFDLEEMEMNADVFESSDSELESEKEGTPRSAKTPKTEDMEDEGMKAKGRWEGWDAVMESPVFDRGSGPSSALPSKSPSMEEPMHQNVPQGSGQTMHRQTPLQKDTSLFSNETLLPEIMQQLPTPPMSLDKGQQLGAAPSPDDDDVFQKRHSRSSLEYFSLSPSSSYPSTIPGPNPETGVVIEPLVLSSSQIISPGSYPPPLSLPASLTDSSGPGNTNALGDIMEGAEEEEEDEKQDEKAKLQENKPETESLSEAAIDPAQIHGLRISLPSSPVVGSSSVSSPVFAFRPLSQSQSATGSHSRTNSLSNAAKRLSWGSVGSGAHLFRSQSLSGSGLQRTGSSGSITSIGSYGHNAPGYGSDYSSRDMGAGGNNSGYDSEGGYDPVGDRAPGNPLFPSNFATLATGPTLVANNPSLRSPPIPPQSKYPRAVYKRKNKFTRRGSNTSGVSGATSNDYAITMGSGSSAVGDPTG